jgi:gas vesicle protein
MDSKSILVGIVIGIVVGGIGGYIASPAPDFSLYEEQISQFQSQIALLENEIDELENQLEDSVSKTEYYSLEQKFASSQQEVSQLESQISSLQSQLTSKVSIITSLQSQISNKDETIDALEDQIDTLQNIFNYTSGSWIVLKTWTGSADKTTELFNVPSDQVRISWDLYVGDIAYFSISLLKKGGEWPVDSWSSLDEQPKGETYAYLSPGEYYFEFSVINCDYTVTVEAITP